MLERKQAELPPFSQIILLRAEGRDKKRVELFLTQVKKQMEGITIAGPFSLSMEKKAGVYRMQLFLQSNSRAFLQSKIAAFLKAQEKQKVSPGLRWIMDVDPMEMG